MIDINIYIILIWRSEKGSTPQASKFEMRNEIYITVDYGIIS